jgi:hypothetical protein
MNKLKMILTGISESLIRKESTGWKIAKNEKPVFITLDEARKEPALVKEMIRQLNEASIITGSQSEYVAGVTFKSRQYYVSGSHHQWLSFYGMDGGVGHRA